MNDLTAYERIAFASSAEPRRIRWTELAVYRHRTRLNDYVAESAGCSSVEGDERLVQRHFGRSIIEVTEGLRQSALTDQLILEAMMWLEERLAKMEGEQ